jgi:hypothetical protein
MKPRNSLTALGAAVLLGSPLVALGDVIWINSDDEAGTRIVITDSGRATPGPGPADSMPSKFGDLSTDRQFIFLGESNGWQLRPMEYRLQGGRLVHVDDPAGHMNRLADTTPPTEQQRIARERSSGS